MLPQPSRLRSGSVDGWAESALINVDDDQLDEALDYTNPHRVAEPCVDPPTQRILPGVPAAPAPVGESGMSVSTSRLVRPSPRRPVMSTLSINAVEYGGFWFTPWPAPDRVAFAADSDQALTFSDAPYRSDCGDHLAPGQPRPA
jgi:hypothetical protein